MTLTTTTAINVTFLGGSKHTLTLLHIFRRVLLSGLLAAKSVNKVIVIVCCYTTPGIYAPMRSVNKTTRPPIRHHRRLTGGDHNVVGPVGADSEVGAWLRPPEPSVRASAESRRDPDGRLFRRSTLPGANWTEPPGIDRFGAAQAAAKPRRGGGGVRGRGRPAAAGATSWVLVAVSPCRPRAALARNTHSTGRPRSSAVSSLLYYDSTGIALSTPILPTSDINPAYHDSMTAECDLLYVINRTVTLRTVEDYT